VKEERDEMQAKKTKTTTSKETGSRRKETESGQEQAEENKGIWGSNNTLRTLVYCTY
jgi:hypothetical protein